MARSGYTPGKKLYDEAAKIVTESQEANYEAVRAKFPNIGTGTLSLIFKELVKRKILRQTTQRRYVVTVNKDGTPKDETELPEARKFRKTRVSRQKMEPPQSNGSDTPIGDRDKLELISTLAKSAGEKTGRILKAVSDDVRFAAKHRKMLSVLQD